jgi:hypothetical protein
MVIRTKKTFTAILLMVVIGCAIWQKLQVVAVASLVGLIALLYEGHAHGALDVCLELLSNAKQARYGDFEIQIEKRLKDFSDLAVKRSVGIQVLLSQLDGQHVSLLLAIAKSGHYSPPETVKDKLRQLRNQGLLCHNATSMREANDVWLSPLGDELARVLAEAPTHEELLAVPVSKPL